MLWLLYGEFWEEQQSKIRKNLDSTKIHKSQYEIVTILIFYVKIFMKK